MTALVVLHFPIHGLCMMDVQTTLVGKLLVAMPGMGDPRFEHSVVYISAHSEDGAMGLIVNKANASLDLKALLGHLDIPFRAATPEVAVHFGGPVEPSRGFLLHSADYIGDPDTLRIDESFAVTATVDAIKDLSRGLGPKTSLLALGYAGWAAGQLEAEIRANGWLICDAEFDLVFNPDNDAKWAAALTSIGVDPTLLSGQAGRA
jgi:putative transcriptional regulator